MLEIGLVALTLADAAGVLVALYWGGLIIGGGLLLISALGGIGGHADVDAGTSFDVDAHAGLDVDTHAGIGDTSGTDLHADLAHAVHAAHGGAAALSTWFSIRFVVFFLALFGAMGVILTHLSTLGVVTTLVVALASGMVVGQIVHHVFRAIRRTSGDSTPQPADYVNKLARVTIAVVPPDQGEIALQVRGGEHYVPAAIGGLPRRFNIGDEVVVIGYRAGVASVVSREEFEQRAR